MIVRKIRKEEYKRVRQFGSLAFEYPMTDSDVPCDELLRRIVEQPQSRQHLYWDSRWAAFEDDDQTMMSNMAVIPYSVMFDGHAAGMMGIGSVATLPQYRRRGGVRACFEKALPDMYEQGAAFSYLYPFSTAFYRKFGYEAGCERMQYKIKLASLPNAEVGGSYHLLEPGAELKDDIRKVYESFSNGYNLMTADEGIDFLWVEKADPFRDMVYTYVYRSADGAPKGMVRYKFVQEQDERILECGSDFWFADREGLLALMQLLKRLMADHSHARFYLPADVRLEALLPELSFGSVECKRSTYGMVRVVDAEGVLRMAKMRGSGDVIIRIGDEQIVQNDAAFRVRFSEGEENTVERTQTAPDISLTIQDFSRLICGWGDVEDWRWLTDVQLHCAPEKAAQVFYRKPMYITRYF